MTIADLGAVMSIIGVAVVLWLLGKGITERRGGQLWKNVARAGFILSIFHGSGLFGVTLVVLVFMELLRLPIAATERAWMEYAILGGIAFLLVGGVGLTLTGWFSPRAESVEELG